MSGQQGHRGARPGGRGARACQAVKSTLVGIGGAPQTETQLERHPSSYGFSPRAYEYRKFSYVVWLVLTCGFGVSKTGIQTSVRTL